MIRRGRRRFLAHVEMSDFSCTPSSDSIQNGTVTQLLTGRAKAKNLLEKFLSQFARRSLRTIQEVRERRKQASSPHQQSIIEILNNLYSLTHPQLGFGFPIGITTSYVQKIQKKIRNQRVEDPLSSQSNRSIILSTAR